MSPLEQYAALTDQHFAFVEVVRDLESEWGVGAPLEKVACRLGVSEDAAVALVVEVAAVGLVSWFPDDGVAIYQPGAVVLGSVG